MLIEISEGARAVMATPTSGKSPASSGKRKRPTAAAASPSTEAAEQMIIEICTRGSGMAKQETLEEQMRGLFAQDAIVSALNSLLSKQRLVSAFYRLDGLQEARRPHRSTEC